MMLNGKVVLVTGSTGGLGGAVTEAFLNAGARVAGVARAGKQPIATENHIELAADLDTLLAAQAVVRNVADQWDRIDVLVHLVGAFAGGKPVADIDDATMEKMFDLNFRSAFHMIRAVLPGMRTQGGGRILAIGSKFAVSPATTVGAYAASKAALVSLIQTVARENADKAITANVVLPGTMDTPANRAAMPGVDPAKWVQPAQVASLLVHVAGDGASAMNGAVIPIYGSEL